jgi:hypothetical protein
MEVHMTCMLLRLALRVSHECTSYNFRNWNQLLGDLNIYPVITD